MFNNLVKQSNGRFSRIGVSGVVMDTDLTEQDVIDIYTEKAIFDAKKDMECAKTLEEKWVTNGRMPEFGEVLESVKGFYK